MRERTRYWVRHAALHLLLYLRGAAILQCVLLFEDLGTAQQQPGMCTTASTQLQCRLSFNIMITGMLLAQPCVPIKAAATHGNTSHVICCHAGKAQGANDYAADTLRDDFDASNKQPSSSRVLHSGLNPDAISDEQVKEMAKPENMIRQDVVTPDSVTNIMNQKALREAEKGSGRNLTENVSTGI